MKTNLRKLILVPSVLTSQLLGQMTFAQPASVGATAATQTQTSTAKANPEKKPTGAFMLGIGIEYAQKIAVEEKGARESSTDMMIAPGYNINSILTATGKTIFSKENSGARQSSVSNTQVGLNIKGIALRENLETTHSIVGVIPTNEDSKKRDRLEGGASVTNGLQWKNPFINVSYKLGLTKNFHEFTVNADNKPNIEYTLTNSLGIIIPVTDKFSLSTAGAYRLGRTYKGFERTAFEISTDINYDILEKLSVNLGVSNDGAALKSNGVDSNIEAYNENTSVVRAGLSLTL